MLHGFDRTSTDPPGRVGGAASLSVSQNGDRDQVLLMIQQYFGCGTLRPDRSDLTMKWEVRNLSLLMSRVVPHFEAYPLLSGKQHDVELFTDVCRRMVRRDHLEAAGLAAIVRLVSEMNPSGVRRYSPTTILTSLLEMKA